MISTSAPAAGVRSTVSAVPMYYDESTPKTFDISIGTGGDMEDPLGQVVRTIQTMWNAIGTIFGSTDLF